MWAILCSSSSICESLLFGLVNSICEKQVLHMLYLLIVIVGFIMVIYVDPTTSTIVGHLGSRLHSVLV